MDEDRVLIFDTTLRDGEQSPGVALGLQEKVEIARQLERLGVDVIEAGFPIASRGEMEAVAAIAREVREPVVAALARTDPRDIDAAYEAVRAARRPRIHTFTSASRVHLDHMLRMTEEEVIRSAEEAVRRARRYVDDVEFSAQDVARAERGFLVRLYGAAVAAGATTLNIPDTVGYAQPQEFAEIVRFLIENVPGARDVVVSVHTHDDLGLAVANALAAVEVGARQVECAVNGIGERAGNCALEEVVMALRTRRDHYRKTTGIRTEEIARTSRLVATLTGMAVPPNKAVVGANAFAHESGIHQDGVLKERTTYEIMRPEDVGWQTNRIVLGKHSGRHAFRTHLETLGYRLDDEQLRRAFARFKELADRKGELSDRDLEAIVRGEVAAPEEVLRLVAYRITAGTDVVPTATVSVERRGEGVREASATGDGPVDAVLRAVDGAVGEAFQLVDYQLRATTGGQDAIGEVSLRVRRASGEEAQGYGASTDVVEASARAYVAALNRLFEGAGPARGGAPAGSAEETAR